MKHLSLLALLFVITCVRAQTPDINGEATKALLKKANAKSMTSDERKELKKIAFALQNFGQNLDELKHDYKGSLKYINQAIMLFDSMDDTLNVANNKKFKGYLLSRLDNFTEAKIEIDESIRMFKLKKADWGVAVSQFDLSRVYEFENKLDSAIYYSNTALVYWQSRKDSFRILGLQTMLINLLTKSGDYTKAISLQKETEKLTGNPELHWLNLIDFYYVSYQLFKRSADTIHYERYKELYTNKLAELSKTGTSARSFYDNDN